MSSILTSDEGGALIPQDLEGVFPSRPGICLIKPHGDLLARGEKTLIVESRRFTKYIDVSLYVVQGNDVVALIKLGEPREITLEQFVARREDHRVSEGERKKWWPRGKRLFSYSFELLESFEPPLRAKVPKRIQTFIRQVKPKSVEKGMNEMITEAAPTNAFEDLEDLIETLPNIVSWIPDFISVAEIPNTGELSLKCKAKWQSGLLKIRSAFDSSFVRSLENLFASLARRVCWHPSFYGPNWCFDSETEVLTKRGWLSFPKIISEDELATLEDFQFLTFQKPRRLLSFQYSGPMVHFKTRSIDIKVTPNHRMIASIAKRVSTSKGKRRRPSKKELRWEFVEAETLAQTKERFYLRTASEWKGIPLKNFILPEVSYRHRTNGPNYETRFIKKTWPELHIPANLFLAFLGWYVSEGYARKGCVEISQKISNPHFSELANTMENLPFSVQRKQYDQNYCRFIISNSQLAEYLMQFGKGDVRRLPPFIKELPPAQIEIFLQSYLWGDENLRENGSGWRGSTISLQLANDLQELGIKLDRKTSIFLQKLPRNPHDIYVIHFSGNRKYIVQNPRIQFDQIFQENYEGQVYCAEIPNGTLLTRRNFKYVYSGNSYFPLFDLSLLISPKCSELTKEFSRNPLPRKFVWIPEFFSMTGSSIYARNREPNDLDIVLRAQEMKDGFALSFDRSLALKIGRILDRSLRWNAPDCEGLKHESLWDLSLVKREPFEARVIQEPEFAQLYYKNWMLKTDATRTMEPLEVDSWVALREAETGKGIEKEEYAPIGSTEMWMPIEAKSWEELEELELKAVKPPGEGGTYKYICESHWRKQSRHVDWWMEENDLLTGYTLLDQIAGKTKEPITTLAAAKKEDAKDQYKIDWKKGEIKKRRIRGDTTRRGQIMVQPKRGKASPSRLSLEGATESGVFHIIDRGIVEFGSQKPGFQEFFLSKGKLRPGRWLIRRIERKGLRDKSIWPDADLLRLWETFSEEEIEEKGWVVGEELLGRGLITRAKLLPPGKPEERPGASAYWTLIQPEEPKRWSAYVLSRRAIKAGWLPAKGYSALPKSIRRAVPKNLRYWTMDRKQALEARRQLAEGKREAHQTGEARN